MFTVELIVKGSILAILEAATTLAAAGGPDAVVKMTDGKWVLVYPPQAGNTALTATVFGAITRTTPSPGDAVVMTPIQDTTYLIVCTSGDWEEIETWMKKNPIEGASFVHIDSD